MEVGEAWTRELDLMLMLFIYYCIAPESTQIHFQKKINSDLIEQNYSVDQKSLIPFGILIGCPLFIVIFVIDGLTQN